jgi:hypothetical protein
VYEGRAFIKCTFPYLLEPILENRSRQPRAICECIILEREVKCACACTMRCACTCTFHTNNL